LLKLVNDATDQLKSDGEIIATSELTGKWTIYWRYPSAVR